MNATFESLHFLLWWDSGDRLLLLLLPRAIEAVVVMAMVADRESEQTSPSEPRRDGGPSEIVEASEWDLCA